jgi:cystathionine beta-lyase/cystathionine gamma-synthase
LKIETLAVHSGDRKPAPGAVPVTTPIYAASSFFYEKLEDLDRVFAREMDGYSYGRYHNPTNAALEELLAALEGGHGALATSSGMTAIEMALRAALAGRPKRVLAADALYGATIALLNEVLSQQGIDVRYVNACDGAAVAREIADFRPGCVLLETISNPLLRVPEIDRIAALARPENAAVIVDNTFATPLMVRPLALGAQFSVHSATKYLAGHGDVLAGGIVCDAAHYEGLRALSRITGPVLGPFESYLTMRGIKTFPLRMERHCANARRVAAWLAAQPAVERVYFPERTDHPDAAAIARLFPPGLYGGMVSFELAGAGRAEVFRFMDRLKLVVRATSLGDVHSLVLYPSMSSHRAVPPEHRERVGIRDNLVRLAVGIEAAEDIIADLEQAL